VSSSVIERYEKVLVIHASDLPKGRGWSPHVYGLLNGDDELCISLIEADVPVDTGVIWTKIRRELLPFYTLNDVIEILSEAHFELFNFAIENFGSIKTVPQCSEIEPTYFERRTPADSELDINKTISEQFNLMRATDPNRFPAFFYMFNKKFTLKLERVDDE
jgi:methionyl-tRNA formyltransferase